MRPSPVLALFALLATLTLAGCADRGGHEGAHDPPAPEAPVVPGQGQEPLHVADASGVAAGVGSCDNLLVHAARQPDPVAIPDGAAAARLEIVYDPAGPAGLNELSVTVHRDEAAVGGANFIARRQGPSPIVIDLTEEDWQDARHLDILAYVCEAPAEQPFTGFASFFASTVPADYTATA